MNIDKKKKSLISLIVVLLVNLSYFRFFRPVVLSDDILKALYYLFLSVAVFFAFRAAVRTKRLVYGNSIILLAVAILVSIFSAAAFWDQGLLITFITTIPFFSFLLYFSLIRLKPDTETLEKAIWIFTIAYLVCFSIALAVAPLRIFSGYGELDKEIDTSRGLARIRLTLIGAGPLYFSYFLAIAKYKQTFNKKWIVVILTLIVAIVLQLGRQAILFSVLLGGLYFLENLNWFKKISIITVIGLTLWSAVTFVPVINNLISKTEGEYNVHQQDEENIRVSAYKFYLFDVSPNVFTVMFGNGQYALGKSSYGDFIDRYGRSQGYIPADVGYASIYLFFGIFGLLIFARILIITLLQKLPDRLTYVRYYILFLFLGNFAGSTLLGSIPLFCIALYIIELNNLKRVANTSNKKRISQSIIQPSA